MRKIAGLLSVVAMAVSAAPAAALPQGNGLTSQTFNCVGLGEVTITHGNGSNGWTVDGHFNVASFSGFEGSELVFTKSFGMKASRSNPVTCSFEEDGFTTVVVAFPTPPGS